MHNHMNKRSKLEHLNMWHFSILQLRLSCLDFNITWLCLEPRSSYPLPLFLKWEEEMWAIKSARKSFNIWKSWFYITLDPYTLFLFASLPLSLSLRKRKQKLFRHYCLLLDWTLYYRHGLEPDCQLWSEVHTPSWLLQSRLSFLVDGMTLILYRYVVLILMLFYM